MSSIKGGAIVIACTLFVAAWAFMGRDVEAMGSDSPREFDLRSVSPGQRTAFSVGELEVEVAVPEGEGHTWGSLRVTIPRASFDSGAVPRDGSLESAWADDVNGDGEVDLVLVVRGGGSGSHASIVLLESSDASFAVRALPPVASTPGYMGHDQVTVRNGRILRSFPTYLDGTDRPGTGEGVDPRPDTNAHPTGRTMILAYDREEGRWRAPS